MPNTVNSYIETDLGNVSPNPRGEYNAKYDYEYLDLIYYKGGSYLCLAPLGETIKNVPPIVGQTTTNWQCVAIPGDLTPEYISMYNEVVKDYNETNTNTADVAQMKDITYASMTAAQESESKASTSETNARNSEVNAKQSMDKAKEYSDEAIRVNNDTQSLVTGFDEHVATAISNAEASISESTDNAKGEIVAQKSSSLNEFRTDAETVMTNEKNIAVAEIHQMVDDFSADADSKKQEVIQVADEKINAMTALKNDAVNAKNAAETAATTAVEKASETATYAGEAKSSSDSAKANADLVSANKIEIDNAKSDVESKVEQFESDLETYSVRTLRSDMTELQKETSDGFAELKGDLVGLEDVTSIKSYEEQLVDVEFETITNAIAYSSTVGASVYTNSNQNCDTIKATVVGGKEYEIRFQTNNNKYALGYIISDADGKSIEVYFNESLSEWVTETKRIVMPDNAKTIWITDMHSASYKDAYIKDVLQKTTLEFKAYTKPEVDELFKTAKKETEEAITSIVNPKRCKILINFDAPTAFVTDGRFALCKKYRLPFTVNVIVNSATSIGYPDSQYGHDYIDEILSYGGDIALYSAYDKPAEDSAIYNGDSESVALFEEYIQKALDASETIGIYHPVAWFSRYQRTGTAMNQALINKGFKICRGYKYGTNESVELFIDRTQFINSDPTRFNVSGGYEISEDSTVSVMKAHIDEAIEQGKDFSVFCHKICADGETPRQGVGTTAENLESVLLYIRQKIDAGLCEAVTFRDYYTELYPSDGMARNYGNAYSRMLFKISG